ncbi:MAG: hypothetical protein GY749_47210 [Desulfobacteraceae bacterium]|nr:hypothetical protein [Desulfobacteraceae bacterium]
MNNNHNLFMGLNVVGTMESISGGLVHDDFCDTNPIDDLDEADSKEINNPHSTNKKN